MCLAVSMIPIAIIGGIGVLESVSTVLIALIFIVTFIVSITISIFITRPIENLTKNIDTISKGKLDVALQPSEIYEINTLTESLGRVMASLKLAIHKVGVKKGEIFEDAVKAKEAYERKQRDLLNSIVGWAWETDSNGIYTYCSNNVTEFLGYHPQELIGKSIYDFIFSEDMKKTKSVFIDSAKKKQIIRDLQNWNITKDGEKICLKTNAVPFYDESGNLLGYRGVHTDITEEKQATVKIKNLNNELTGLRMEITKLLNEREKGKFSVSTTLKKSFDDQWTEHEFDSVFIFDENANVLDCNKNMHQRLGYSKSEMLNLNISDFDALESKNDLIDKINKAKKAGNLSFKTIHKRKDGSAILVQENFQYDKAKGEFKAIVREDYSLKKSK